MTERPAKYRAETNQVPAWSSIRVLVFGSSSWLLLRIGSESSKEAGTRTGTGTGRGICIRTCICRRIPPQAVIWR